MQLVPAYFLTSVCYLLLATRIVLPIYGKASISSAVILLLILIFMLLFHQFRRKFLHAIIWVGPIFLLYLLFGFRTLDTSFFIAKVEGAFLVTLLTASILGYVKRVYGVEKLVLIFVHIGFFVLLLTVAYKIQFGFTDRAVRFFINGPIVFGWLMSLCAFLSLYLVNLKKPEYIVLFGCFFLAVIWVQSKGPLIALGIVSALTIIRYYKTILSIKFIAFSLLASFGAFIMLPNDLFLRLGAIQRVLNSNVTAEDGGTIGERIFLWKEALSIWKNHPIVGIGPGNWSYFSITEHGYPHNIFLEILAETGTIFFLLFVFYLILLFFRTTGVGRLVIAIFVVALSFSGDISYLCMMIVFPIVFINPKTNHQFNHSRSNI